MPLDTELHKAANKGDIQGVRDIVESGAIDVNEKGAQDRTALHRAAGANHVGIINFLLQSGAPVDCVDRCLRTPLHWAAISGHLDATQLLLHSGGDLRRKTMSGMNPLMCAVQQRWHRVAEAILEWSAGCGEEEDEDEEHEGGQIPSPAELCSTTDVEGKSAVVYAKEHSDIPMQKLLKSYAPKKPSASCCCGGAKEQQLTAVVSPPRDSTAEAAGAARTAGEQNGQGGHSAATAVVSNGAGALGRTKVTGVDAGGGDGGRGWLRRLCCSARCCGTPVGESNINNDSSGSRSGVPSGATVRDADPAPSNFRPPSTMAAGPFGCKAAEPRHGTATGSGSDNRSVGSVGVGSINTSRIVGGNLSVSASREGARVRNGKPASNNTNVKNAWSSVSAQSTPRPPENTSLPESSPTSVPKDKPRGVGGGKGTKQSASSSSSGSSSSRRHRGDHGGGLSEGSAPGGVAVAGGERRPRKSRSSASGGKERRAGDGDSVAAGVV